MERALCPTAYTLQEILFQTSSLYALTGGWITLSAVLDFVLERVQYFSVQLHLNESNSKTALQHDSEQC